MGRKKKAHYRVVVADSASPRDGRFVETLGYYKPLSHPARLVIDLGRVDHWIGEGAQPSTTVKSLISKARAGGDATVALGEVGKEEREAKRAEQLAARQAAEVKAGAAAAAEAAVEAAAAEAAAAEAAAAEAAAEAEAEEAPAEEAAAEAEAEEAPAEEAAAEAEAEEAPAEEAAEEPAADAEETEEEKSE
jgi:small subunit ribosomal protein S16